MDFNYQKAYCTQALPSFNSFDRHVLYAHKAVSLLVADLHQQRDLNIPLNDEILKYLNPLTCLELSQLSRASYFVGHWNPSLLPRPFENKSGQSWKISNCCDQILRQRLLPYRTLQIHEGKFRVTFSNKDCWLWDEFALATEENLEIFKKCNLPFGENSLEKSAKILRDKINDLWGNPDNEPDNELYKQYLELAKQRKLIKIKKGQERTIEKAKQAVIDAQKEHDFLVYCVSRNIDIDNVIYYGHTGKFCFGWRNKLTQKEVDAIVKALNDQGGHDIPNSCPYNVEFKTV